jgi:putative redox protein
MAHCRKGNQEGQCHSRNSDSGRPVYFLAECPYTTTLKSKGEEMITGHRKQNYVAELASATHSLIADLPPGLGGTDLGPDPHELLEAALAACTILTVQLYADRKMWKLESTDVKVSIDKEGAQSHLTREISFRGELSEEQVTRLLEIADKCPIHKLLTSDVSISTTLKAQA